MNPTSQLLIVDDEPHMLETLRDVLEEFGWEVFCVTSGQAAIEHVRRMSAPIVLMDYRMPGLSGVEAASKMLSECPELVVLLMSADVGDLWKQQALEQGVRCVVQKPLDLPCVVRLLTGFL